MYKDDCNTEAAKFLLIGGGLVLVSSALNIFAYLTPCKCDDRFAELVTPLVSFVHFVVVIWGSIVVFGKFLTAYIICQIPKKILDCMYLFNFLSNLYMP